MFLRPAVSLLAVLLNISFALAAPPKNRAEKKIYDHNYKWLENAQINFIAANIRGASDDQYRERRQAALDLLRAKHDLTTVPELMDELQRKSFLSGDICEMLAEFKAKKALPLLREVATDEQRPADVREKASKAIAAITSAPVDAGPPTY